MEIVKNSKKTKKVSSTPQKLVQQKNGEKKKTEASKVYPTFESILADMDTGILDEVTVLPSKIEFFEDPMKGLIATITVGNDKQYVIEEPISKDVVYYWRGQSDYNTFFEKNAQIKNEIVAEWMSRKPKILKLRMDSTGKITSLRSKRGEQINYKDIFTNVFKAVEQTYGLPDEIIQRGKMAAWTMKVPVASGILQFYVEVYGGSNENLSNRSIEVVARARTIAPLAGMEAACLNWCTFKSIAKWFNISVATVKDAAKLSNIAFRTIHTASGQTNVKDIIEVFRGQKEALEEASKLIDKYVYTPLTPEEIKLLISMYAKTRHLPKYVLEDIPDLMYEGTIWGLSNAFSYFRTHCEYKRKTSNKDEVGLTKTLEFIAGELIMVSPLIAELKTKNGQLTEEVLFPKSAI